MQTRKPFASEGQEMEPFTNGIDIWNKPGIALALGVIGFSLICLLLMYGLVGFRRWLHRTQRAMWLNGYIDGFNSGDTDGFEKGYSKGGDDGYHTGYHDGYKSGDAAGYKSGHYAGWVERDCLMIEQYANNWKR